MADRNNTAHTFHIPVMGLGYTIDTPLKVARFGISSVVSIIEDELVERMREFHCGRIGEPYIPIPKNVPDHRAKRVTAYLDLLDRAVRQQMDNLQLEEFKPGSDIVRYFEMLPDGSEMRRRYEMMTGMGPGEEQRRMQEELRRMVHAGSIDVNIMAKIDRTNYAEDGTPLPAEFADAMAAFRGFARSTLSSSVVLSAGYNPRLYAYIAQFDDFLPDAKGVLKKEVILKVSDMRSALIQGKILAKKGVWVSEFRIESGLNCGGHAFATDGLLLGPILHEFRVGMQDVRAELFDLCNKALVELGREPLRGDASIRVTVQGGIGTTAEDCFLRSHYGVDGTGWGSPFLLVPEATNVDERTLKQLTEAAPQDFYMSWASPLGIPFHNFRRSTSEAQRKARIDRGRPGSPCYKEFLSTNTEFTDVPICTASRQYQDLKIKQLQAKGLEPASYTREMERITEKDCLCEGLGAAALLKAGLTPAHKLEAVAICPGPNLAYFSKVVPLRTMIDHIYGRTSLVNTSERPHMFVKELELYVQYFTREINEQAQAMTTKGQRYLRTFKENLLNGIRYYEALLPEMNESTPTVARELVSWADRIHGIQIPELVSV